MGGGGLFEKHGILNLRAMRPITIFWLEGGGALRRVGGKFDIKVEFQKKTVYPRENASNRIFQKNLSRSPKIVQLCARNP